jgi:DNA-directed RNA polymerase subunit RPC12/RpoP
MAERKIQIMFYCVKCGFPYTEIEAKTSNQCPKCGNKKFKKVRFVNTEPHEDVIKNLREFFH